MEQCRGMTADNPKGYVNPQLLVSPSSLAGQLADSAIYEDKSKLHQVLGAHTLAQKKAVELFAAWEAAALELE